MRTLAIAMLIGGAVLSSGGVQAARAQSDSEAVTVEISDGPVIGHRVAAMTVMNSPCDYGEHYHFELTPEGELRVHGPIICGKVNAGGGEQVCYLGVDLSCHSRQEFSPDPGTAYSVDAKGVRANGKLYAWANPQQAASLFGEIRTSATRKCDHILFDEARDARGSPPPTPTPYETFERIACKPVLQQVCSAAHSGAARLENGKEVSILCPK